MTSGVDTFNDGAQSPSSMRGAGLHPVTISAPGIHFTTSHPAKAIVWPDCVFFIAYDQTYTKRVLHPMRLIDGLSFHEERPLYLESTLTSSTTTTIRDLLHEKFGTEPVALHLLVPGSGPAAGQDDLEDLKRDLFDLAAELPAIALNVRVWRIPAPPSDPPPGPRTIFVSNYQPDVGPVFVDVLASREYRQCLNMARLLPSGYAFRFIKAVEIVDGVERDDNVCEAANVCKYVQATRYSGRRRSSSE
ncbi:hypothetical protein ANO11243_027370 [Dothideomycetidae sp. 11243]|nr:hypothetical protein ANO11243_027370 [fungal sp. No.11243]